MCKALAGGTTIMGEKFITSATIVGGGFRGIAILMCLGL
jgi:hypothetical protein